MGTYYIFLSCNQLFIDDEHIQKYINDRLSPKKDVFIKCIPKHDDLEYSKDEIDGLAGSSIYIVNTNEELDYVNSWELGYAMGKGLQIIGYPNGEKEVKIPEDMRNLLRPMPKNIYHFMEKINRALDKLAPKEEVIKEDWNQQPLPANKEFRVDI